MEYNVLYNLEFGSFQFQVLIIPISLIVLGFLAIRQIRKYGFIHPMQIFGFFKDLKLDLFGKFISFLFAFFGLIILIVMLVKVPIEMAERKKVKEIIETGNYKIVKGPVENFLPSDNFKNDYDSFEISGVSFSYSEYDNFYGYSKTSKNGGVIRSNGQNLRISYYFMDGKNIILKIEIAKSH